MLKRLIEAWRIRRLRPGIIFAAQIAEQQAYRHPNAGVMGPEQNLIKFAASLSDRLRRAEGGELTGLYLDPVVSAARRRAHG